ncbi:esterase [Lithospermum erythrorhizon]|uniref:Pectinesterase n=1 Tax=Lithospermum erythrorhizon TaxID=34254 RepID=A0AAV3P4S5_LITER
MKMIGKIVASVVSLLLVVGIVIGLVLNSHVQNKEQTPSTSMKPVTSFCEPTTYKDLCAKSIGEVAKNESATGKDFLLAAFKATMVELESTKQKAGTVQVDKSQDLYHYRSVQDCQELVDYALDALNDSIAMIGKSDGNSVNDIVDELLNFLGGVNAFQTTCLDNFQNAELKKQIQDIMTNANQLTDNAINIVADMSQVLKSLNVSIPNTLQSNKQRRLLAVHGEANDGYPSWFPAADRELLRNVNGRRRLPNAVVAKDGSGQFRTITDALNAMPKGYRGRYIIYVKAGIYDEKVFIDKTKPFVLIYGDGPGRTIVTGSDNYGIKKTPTWKTATFASVASGVVIKSMTIRNTAGPDGHQAVALRVQGDMTAVFDCSLEGFQDTLYYHTFRQFYRNCAIFGTVDFIFGQGSAMIQTSTIVVRKPGRGQSNTVTADGNEKNALNAGLVIHVSRIVPEFALVAERFAIKTYLGRPWKAIATTILLRCELGDFIRPEGWLQWQGEGFHNTCNYGEFANVGPGAGTNMRDKSFKRWRVLSPQEADRYTLASFLGDAWLRKTTVPFISGMY